VIVIYKKVVQVKPVQIVEIVVQGLRLVVLDMPQTDIHVNVM
jgi:hypothetical protein